MGWGLRKSGAGALMGRGAGGDGGGLGSQEERGGGADGKGAAGRPHSPCWLSASLSVDTPALPDVAPMQPAGGHLVAPCLLPTAAVSLAQGAR